MTIKNCKACNRPIKGRTDKKFCDDSCRNKYNSHIHSRSITVIRNINNVLRKNRRILEELLSGLEKKVLVVERKKLVEMGFQFEYFTGHFHSDTKELYYCCYDYGYHFIDNEKVVAVIDARKK
jgi:hypothetical protein